MTDWVVSQSDVEKHPQFEKWNLDQILFSYGMDIKEGYNTDTRNEEEVGRGETESHHGFTHRSVFTGEIHTCPRYFGTARTDGAWKRFTENFVAA
jgi:hypothetical protein